jgi:HAD superfamily hydrolase (TIGR01509 family)
MRRAAGMALIIMSRVRRAVLFDAGNTLLLLEHAAIASHLGSRGHAVSVAQVEDAELRARVRLDDHLAAGVSTESLDTRERYLRYILEPLGITADDEVAAISDWRRDYNRPAGLYTRPDPDAVAALARIRTAGLVAGVISNSNGHAEALLVGAGLAAGVDFVIDSGIVGVEKPDPRIFALGLEAAGVAPSEAVYVGDLYSVDVLGARGAGLDGILLDPRGYWGDRGCLRATGLLDAVRLAIG